MQREEDEEEREKQIDWMGGAKHFKPSRECAANERTRWEGKGLDQRQNKETKRPDQTMAGNIRKVELESFELKNHLIIDVFGPNRTFQIFYSSIFLPQFYVDQCFFCTLKSFTAWSGVTLI